MGLLDEMLALGHGHDWTEPMRVKYGGTPQQETRRLLGMPARTLTTPGNEPVDEYFVGAGFLDLKFSYDTAARTWMLAGCHLG